VVVLKSQIHAGGRGKGTFKEHPDLRGVNVITDGVDGGPDAAEEKVRDLAGKMLGSTLVTVQTGPEGKVVNRLYLEQGIDIERELYLAILLDRSVSRNIVMASTEGGMEIEKVAEETPEKILREEIDPAIDLADFQANALAHGLGIEGDTTSGFVRFVKALDRAATELDTDLIEINPLVITGGGQVMALDGKMGFDDNSLFRHPDIAAMRDETEEDPAELAAKEAGLNYIKLDGTIGCLVNGAGLAMATMDTIKHVGGEPANFLDVGGGADEQQVTTAFQIITKDPSVKGIFVNIFGGIMRCDVIATGIIAAVKTVGLSVPLVVRLEGTNVEEGKRILNESGLDLVAADSLKDGAEKIVELTR
jgi:succinyl-CoA synthetase beta subunit